MVVVGGSKELKELLFGVGIEACVAGVCGDPNIHNPIGVSVTII
jgi:hypothetical protein